MFTGIVEKTGRILDVRHGRLGRVLRVAIPRGFAVGRGDSVAVSGTCLTAEKPGRRAFEAHVGPETLARTTLGKLRKGDPVNLERAMRADSRFGGHVVLGHVDGVAKVRRVRQIGRTRRIAVSVPVSLVPFIAAQGSVTLDGVSLTVAKMTGNTAEMMLIPHTLSVTTLSTLGAGSRMNLEIDVVARYLAKRRRLPKRLRDLRP